MDTARPIYKAVAVSILILSITIAYFRTTRDSSRSLTLLSILFSFVSGVTFASDNLPILQNYVLPNKLQEAWEELVTTRKIARDHRGFENLFYTINTRTELKLNQIIKDKHKKPDLEYPLWRNIHHIGTKNKFAQGDWIYIAYEEGSVPYSSDDATAEQNKKDPIEKLENDIRSKRSPTWVLPVSAGQDAVLRQTNDKIGSHVRYGGLFLSIAFISQLIKFLS